MTFFWSKLYYICVWLKKTWKIFSLIRKLLCRSCKYIYLGLNCITFELKEIKRLIFSITFKALTLEFRRRTYQDYFCNIFSITLNCVLFMRKQKKRIESSSTCLNRLFFGYGGEINTVITLWFASLLIT